MTDEEFRTFIAARGSALRRTAYFLTGDWQLGEDLTQSALLEAWRHLSRIQEAAAVESYVRTTMTRTYLSWRRKRSFAEIPGATTAESATSDLIETALERNLIWAALQNLSAQQRAALVLRYYEDLTIDTIADMLNTRPGTVKSSLSRGLVTLRLALDTDPTKESQ